MVFESLGRIYELQGKTRYRELFCLFILLQAGTESDFLFLFISKFIIQICFPSSGKIILYFKKYLQSSLIFLIDLYFFLSDIEVLINIRQEMICFSVAGLIGSNAQYHISESSSFRKVIVIYCFLGCWSCPPQLKRSILAIYIFQHGCVCLNCLFLKITDESMAKFWVEDVRDEKRVHENTLNCDNQSSFQNSRPSKIKEGNQMEPLIISLFQQMMNPSIISVQCPQRTKMSCHSPHNPRHSGHRLQNNTSIQPFSFSHLAGIIGCEHIVRSSYEFDAQISKTISKSLRSLVLIMHSIQGCLWVDIVRKSSTT